jgi:adenosylcobinamide-phosphate synthase
VNLELQIILALMLDSILGDPRWLPHPVRFIGWLALKSEKFCRGTIAHEKSAGVVTVLIVLAVTGLAAWTVLRLAASLNPWLGEAVSVLILYTCFAARDLIVHSTNVYTALQSRDLPKARKMVAMVVGRDTAELDEGGVVRACVESVAENTVDGVIAPLFWAIIGGPLGAILYKAVNTLDSTFGYKNEQYLHFGWVAARLDDVVNWLPARITGVLVTAVAFLPGFNGLKAWEILKRDRLQHASPNSGHSEAAVAGALGLQLGGLNYYFGKPVSKPTIGDNENPPVATHIALVNHFLIAATILAAAVMLGGRVLIISFLR